MKTIILNIAIALLATHALATSPVIPNPYALEERIEYKLVDIAGYDLKGVNVFLSAEIKRHDCNRVSLKAESILVTGQGNGMFDKYLFEIDMPRTDLGCPIDEPVSEVIKSEALFFSSNQERNLSFKILVPAYIDVQVVEVK